MVTKVELRDAEWGQVVVEEGTLQVHISALRKLLGSGVIVAIPERGYQFNPPGLSVSSSDVMAAAAHVTPPPISNATTESAAALARPTAPALFGRDDEFAAFQSLLATHPVVTIAGPGGIGKKRLARAALAALANGAGRPTDGSAVVKLAALNDAALIPVAIAEAFEALAAAAQPSTTPGFA